jgi:hypothetical protein
MRQLEAQRLGQGTQVGEGDVRDCATRYSDQESSLVHERRR